MLKANCLSLKKLRKHKVNLSIDIRGNAPIPVRELSISNDLLSLTHFKNSSNKIKSSNKLNGHSVNSSHHPRENSLSTTFGQKILSPLTYKPINNNNTDNFPKKSRNNLQKKDDELDFVYKKMFLFSIRKHKFKEKFNYNNLDNLNSRNRLSKREKNRSKETEIGSKINHVNQKLGFIKGIVDYCYPSQFILKIKESKRLLNKASYIIPKYYCSDNNLEARNNLKEKHYQILSKSINIKSIPIRQLNDNYDNDNNNNVL